MTGDDRTRAIHQAITLGLAAILATALAFGAVGMVWAHDLRAPRVTLLGAGDNAISVFVTAGSARLLIATGDDPAALTTALERARHPTNRRIDVVLLAGAGRALLGPVAIATEIESRYLATIGELPPSAETSAIRAAGATPLTTAKRITLNDDVTVDLEIAAGADEATDWRVIVRRRDTAVAIVSTSAAVDQFPWRDPVSALVVTSGGDPLAAWAEAPAPLLAFPDEAMSGADLRQAVSDSTGPEWVIRLFPGEAVRLGFGPEGLAAPAASAMPLGSPASGRRRGRPGAGTGQTPP